MKRLGRLARKTNSAMLLLAHIDKAAAKYGAAGNSYSGSTAWHNSARSRLAILDTDDGRQLVHEKNNLGKLAEPIALEWTEIGTVVPADSSMAEAKQAATDALVLQAIQNASDAGQSVPTARTGTATTWHTLSMQETLPEFMRNGGAKGKRAMYAAIDRLRSASQIRIESYKNEHRKERQRLVCADAPICADAIPAQISALAQTEHDMGSASCAHIMRRGYGGYKRTSAWAQNPQTDDSDSTPDATPDIEPAPAPATAAAGIPPSGWSSLLIKPLKGPALIQRLQEKGYSNAGAAIQAAVKDGIIEKVHGGEYRCAPLRQSCADAKG